MRKTILSIATLIALTGLASADYKFASIQSVEAVDTTLQTATKDLSLVGSTLTVSRIDNSTSTIDLSSASPKDYFKQAGFDGSTKKLTFTRDNGTSEDIDLSGAGTNINVSSAVYDRPTKKLTLTLTNGATVSVVLVIDKSDIGLSEVDNISDADKPIPSSVAIELAKKKVVDVDLNSDNEIIISYNDGTTKTL